MLKSIGGTASQWKPKIDGSRGPYGTKNKVITDPIQCSTGSPGSQEKLHLAGKMGQVFQGVEMIMMEVPPEKSTEIKARPKHGTHITRKGTGKGPK